MRPLPFFELIIGMFLAVLVLQDRALRLRLPPAVALLRCRSERPEGACSRGGRLTLERAARE
jgi:hypothetical protein